MIIYLILLFKRLRNFVWIEPVHEQVRLDPVVFDSDIVITHMPESNHSGRDFAVFERAIIKDGDLSDRLWDMYARELYLAGSDEDFIKAESYFERKAIGGAASVAIGDATVDCVHGKAGKL